MRHTPLIFNLMNYRFLHPFAFDIERRGFCNFHLHKLSDQLLRPFKMHQLVRTRAAGQYVRIVFALALNQHFKRLALQLLVASLTEFIKDIVEAV